MTSRVLCLGRLKSSDSCNLVDVDACFIVATLVGIGDGDGET